MTEACVAYGPLVAVVVATLKRIPWIGARLARNAKVVAVLASALASLAAAGTVPQSAAEWAAFATCVATVFAGAVATHEVALDPLAKALGVSSAKNP